MYCEPILKTRTAQSRGASGLRHDAQRLVPALALLRLSQAASEREGNGALKVTASAPLAQKSIRSADELLD